MDFCWRELFFSETDQRSLEVLIIRPLLKPQKTHKTVKLYSEKLGKMSLKLASTKKFYPSLTLTQGMSGSHKRKQGVE